MGERRDRVLPDEVDFNGGIGRGGPVKRATRKPTKGKPIVTMPDIPAEAECDGLCVSAADIGLPEYNMIAYPHPGCPLHGGGVKCPCDVPDRCLSYTHDPAWTPGLASVNEEPPW